MIRQLNIEGMDFYDPQDYRDYQVYLDEDDTDMYQFLNHQNNYPIFEEDQENQEEIYQPRDYQADSIVIGWNFPFPFSFNWHFNFNEYQQPLTQAEWYTIKKEANLRHKNDSQCSICLESLKERKKKLTILCCSHVFHKLCIQSCEQATTQKRCPLCRNDNYQQIEYTLKEKKQKKMVKQGRDNKCKESKVQTLTIRQKIVKQKEIITKATSTYLYRLKLRYFAIEQNHQSNGKLNLCCCY